MRILLLSNGHGEDAIAASVGSELRRRGAEVAGLPLVGSGAAYGACAIERLGPARPLPSGGYTLSGRSSLWRDLRGGLIAVTAGQLAALRRAAKWADACLSVGDWYPLLLATALGVPRRFCLQSAMSVRAWPADAPGWKSPFGPLERRLMRSCGAVYLRDEASSRWLEVRGVRSARHLGNPMLDALAGDEPLEQAPPYLLLLPGSRADALFSLPLMLEAYRRLPAGRPAGVVAWAAGFEPPVASGWELRWAAGSGRYRHTDGSEVAVARRAFATAVRGARAAISTSGTAAEQCAGLGVPLVGFETPGPQYVGSFAGAQRRALGHALTLVAPEPAAVASVVQALLCNEDLRERARRDGREAMGQPGAAARVADDLLGTLKGVPR